VDFFWLGWESISLTISDSTGVVRAAEVKCHIWKRFRWWFLIRQWLSSCWLFCDSTGAVCADKSRHDLWKRFRWGFLNRQWLSFPRLFLSQQGLCALKNPRVTCGSGLVDDFQGDNDSIFLDYILLNRGCVLSRIHTSHVEAFSMMISESAATQFSLAIFESLGAVCNDESSLDHWKQFRWWFLDRQWLSSPWLFLTQQELYVLTNSSVTCGSCRYNRGYVHCRIHTSLLEDVSLMISKSTVTQFFADYFWVHRGCVRQGIHSSLVKVVSLRWYLWFCSDSVFVDYFWVNSGFMRWRIHALPMEAVLLMIYELVTT